MQFEDRLALHPGRLLITPVDPAMAPFLADTKWADEPVNEGTPLNAETFNTVLRDLCRVCSGIYIGTESSKTAPKTLVFPFKPLAVLIQEHYPEGSTSTSYLGATIAIRDSTSTGLVNASGPTPINIRVNMQWGEDRLTINTINTNGSFNQENHRYFYVAIGE